MLERAVAWVKKVTSDEAFVPISHRNRAPYPEVTGYWIPTLLQAGQHRMAEGFAHWLVTIQNPDGSFSLDSSGETFVFDTGQIIRGWAAIAKRSPGLLEPLQRACDWIVGTADPRTGKFAVPRPGHMWSLGRRGEVNEGIHLYVIQPLRDAAAVLASPRIRAAADRALAAYVAAPDITCFDRPNALTHFYAYIQEALVETGHRELALAGMNSVARYMMSNGSIPAYHDVPWICTPGLAQLAKVWFMLGDERRGELALSFVRSLQNHSGGFYGSYGPGAEYFPADEISWAAKYAIDAELIAVQRHFDATSGQYAAAIDASDGRAQAVLAACRGAVRVLDAGCGKGRYAATVKAQVPASEIHAVDISADMLAAVPKGIHTHTASLQDLPFPDATFDVVYCIEALEHAPNAQAAVAEMARVLRPGGQLLIIDKNADRLGSMAIERWEMWFDRDRLAAVLDDCGLDCEVADLSYDGKPADGLFLGWRGVKRAHLRRPAFMPSIAARPMAGGLL